MFLLRICPEIERVGFREMVGHWVFFTCYRGGRFLLQIGCPDTLGFLTLGVFPGMVVVLGAKLVVIRKRLEWFRSECESVCVCFRLLGELGDFRGFVEFGDCYQVRYSRLCWAFCPFQSYLRGRYS